MLSKHRVYLMWTVVIVILMVVGTCNVARAGDYSSANATDKCWFKIEALYPGSQYENPCRVTDTGDGWFIVWNMACPFILADPTTGPRRTGAACEVNKTTGDINYLAVSARELIK